VADVLTRSLADTDPEVNSVAPELRRQQAILAATYPLYPTIGDSNGAR
jgi:hypothetical protein